MTDTAPKLTDEQRDALIGLSLGGGRFESADRGRTYAFVVDGATELAQSVLGGLEQSADGTTFRTISSASFRFYAQQFQKPEGRRVPKLIHRWLNETAMKYWCLSGTVPSSEDRLDLDVSNFFEPSDKERLVKALATNFDVDAKIVEREWGTTVRITGDARDTLLSRLGMH